MSRLDQVMALNPEYAEALRNNEPWALKHAEAVRGLDGGAGRRHPERAFREDGLTKRNWCGTCSHREGCITCDLDGDHIGMKGYVGKHTD